MGGATLEYPGQSCMQETDSPTNCGQTPGLATCNCRRPELCSRRLAEADCQTNNPGHIKTLPVQRSSRRECTPQGVLGNAEQRNNQ